MAPMLVPVVHNMIGVLGASSESLKAVENDTNVSQIPLTSMLLAG